MARFKHADRSQGLFMTVNLNEQLEPDTFEWTIDQLVDWMDMSIFEERYQNEEKGSDAYSPSILFRIGTSTVENRFLEFLFDAVYEKPIRFDMTFPPILMFAMQRVVFMFRQKRLLGKNQAHYFIEFANIFVLFFRSL